MLTLSEAGGFISTDEAGEPKELGVIATQKRGRWQYRPAEGGNLIASGVEPARFAERYWFRKDYTAPQPA